MEGILEHAGQAARFLFLETAGDDGIAAVNRGPDARRGLDLAVEHDGETMADIRLGDLAEFLCAFAVELQLHRPAFIAIVGVRFGHPIAPRSAFFFTSKRSSIGF